jgi:hypothetical protein
VAVFKATGAGRDHPPKRARDFLGKLGAVILHMAAAWELRRSPSGRRAASGVRPLIFGSTGRLINVGTKSVNLEFS